MASVLPIKLNPQILLWARSTIGYSIKDVAEKLAIKEDKVIAWEKGIDTPTYKQLESLAYKIYKRPLAVFFRTTPPIETPIDKDFRNITSSEVKSLSTELRLVIRKAKRFQNLIAELDTDELNEHKYKDFQVSIKERPSDCAIRFREFINLSIEAQMSWNQSNAYENYKKLIEDIGIYIFQYKMPFDEARAFSLTDTNPVIVLNTEDAKYGRIFSLFHEVCHILFNTGGLFKDLDTKKLKGDYKAIEDYCNHFAASVLLPDIHFKKEIDFNNQVMREWSEAELQKLSRIFSVSREVILRKLVNLKLASEQFYFTKKRQWNIELKNYRQFQKEKQAKKAKETGVKAGIPVDIKTISEKGKPYVSSVIDSYEKGKISYGQLSEYLEVKLESIDKIIDRLHKP